MVKCFIVNCKTGYASNKDKFSLFGVPKDPLLFVKWKNIIPKRERELMTNSAVCSKHFEPSQIIREWTSGHIKYALKKPRLKEGAIPTIFPDIPKSCLKSIPKARKSPKKRLLLCDTQIIQSSDQTTEDILFDCELETSTVTRNINQFSAWNSVEMLKLPNLSWSLFNMQHFKIIASIEMSLHSDPETIIFKEVRILESNNFIQSLIFGKVYASTTCINSLEELKSYLEDFNNINVCHGSSLPAQMFHGIDQINNGYINRINRWQSKNCTVKIDNFGSGICQPCFNLEKALKTRKSRSQISNSKPKISTLLSPSKKLLLKRKLDNSNKVKLRLLYKNRQLNSTLHTLQQQLTDISENTVDNHIKRLNLPYSQAMAIRECMRVGKYNAKTSRRYSNDWLLTCILLHIRGPALYKYILNNKILPLPCSQTIKRQLSRVKLSCGFDEQFFEAFKKKMEAKSEQQKHGVLIFDEMSVRKSLKLDPKSLRYQGVVDFGNDDDVYSTDNNSLADHALVFGFSSLYENNFQPIGCFAAKGATAGVILAKLIVQAILMLEYAGAKVTALVCDGAKPNRRMWQEFGISGELGKMKNSFKNPYDDSRIIFVLSDVPHLFKCVRNRLISNELMTSFGLVRWRHIVVLHKEDKKSVGNVRICPKLTESHIYPCSFAKMRVSLMTQVFSKSVSVGLNLYRERLVEELEDSEPTSKFVLHMNNLFDSLNRKYPGEGIKFNSPDIKVIKNGIEWLDSWETEMSSGIIPKGSFLTKETSEGLRVTLHSTIDLIEYLLSIGFDYVLTAKANQDQLEKFFGTVRQAGCQNDHPAMPTFLQLYRLLSTYKLLKPPKFGNCTISEDDTNNGTLSLEEFKNIFDNDNPSNTALQRLKIRLDSIIECEQWDEEDEIASNSSYISNPEVVDIAIYYASGYLCRRLIKTSCTICQRSFLTNLETSKLAVAELVNKKTKGYLMYCNLYLYKLFQKAEEYFVINVMQSDCYERTMTDMVLNVQMNFPCEEHKSNVIASCLHYYIRMRMRHYEREQNRNQKKKSKSKKKEAKVYQS